MQWQSPTKRARMQPAEESEFEPLAEGGAAAAAAFLPNGALAFLGAGGVLLDLVRRGLVLIYLSLDDVGRGHTIHRSLVQ
jgi:hypothetical protein